jgi:hypothetical protein
MDSEMIFVPRDESAGRNPAIIITRGNQPLTCDQVARLVRVLNAPSVATIIAREWAAAEEAEGKA